MILENPYGLGTHMRSPSAFFSGARDHKGWAREAIWQYWPMKLHIHLPYSSQ